MIALLIATALAHTAPAHAAEFESELSVNRIRLSQLTLYSPKHGNVFTAEAGWAPAYYFSHRWGFVGTASVTALKGSDDSAFPATELTLAAQYAVDRGALLELGGGVETWMNAVGSFPLATARVVSPLRVAELERPIQLIFGYSTLFVDDDHLTHQLQIGVGFQL